jgi:hypothetical protein
MRPVNSTAGILRSMTAEGVARRLVAAVVIGLSIAWLVWTLNGFTLSDAHAYRMAAARLIAGSGLYQATPSQDDAFRYAPWFAAAWVPIASLPRALGDGLWAVALVVASVASVVPFARRPGLASRLLAVFGGTMLLWTAARGNVHPLMIAGLVHGVDRRSGPIWIGLAASLKAVPILFALVYLARREWWRAALSVAVAAVLVAPMPLLGWDPARTNPGESISLFYLVSPAIWVVVAGLTLAGALLVAWKYPRYVGPAAAAAVILALPRLLLYDLTYVLVGTEPVEE